MKWAITQDLITKNPCDFCKPPKRVKTPINALNRAERTRMMRLARAAQPQPLGIAIELALITGMHHTFATMMIAGGTDVRTVASYLGHASVSMTLNIYADVDPDAKKAAVSKVQDCFDMDFDLDDESAPATALTAPGISFSVEQLEAMLQTAKAQQAMAGVA